MKGKVQQPSASQILKRFTLLTHSSKYPWSCVSEFMDSPQYGNLKLYPNQRLLFKLFNCETEYTREERDLLKQWGQSFTDSEYTIGLPSDVLDRIHYLREHGYEHFTKIILVLGRRASKTFMCGAELAYVTACRLHLNKHTGDNIENVAVIATTEQQARSTIFADYYRNTITNNYLKQYIIRATPFLLEFQNQKDHQYEQQLRREHTVLEKSLLSLVARPYTSNSNSIRGLAIPFFAFDEAFFAMGGDSARSGDQAIHSILPAQRQFGRDQLSLFPSSPWRRSGELYSLYQKGCQLVSDTVGDPTTLVVQLESWRPYERWNSDGYTRYWGDERPLEVKDVLLENREGEQVRKRLLTRGMVDDYVYMEES